MATETNQQGTKITLYWLEKSRAQRIVWLLEELKLDFELKIFKRGKDLPLAPPELKEIHPLGKSPLVGVQAGDAEKPLVLAESGAIIEYLSDHFGKWLIPKKYPEGKEGVIGAETEQWLRYRYLMHYAEGSLMSILVVALVVNNIRDAPVPFFIKPITRGIAGRVNGSYVNPEVKLHLDFLENYLATSPDNGEFFCGSQLSAADIIMSFPLEGSILQGSLTEKAYPKLYSWVKRVQARDAYKQGGERIERATGEKFVPFSETSKP